MKFDDGVVEEYKFLQLVNKQAKTATLSKEEIDSHIQVLCNEGKVMKREGTIYMID
jgi:hypothetical protein